MLAGQVLVSADLSAAQSSLLSEAILSLSTSTNVEEQFEFVSAVERNALWVRPGWLNILQDMGASTSDDVLRQRVFELIERLRRRKYID